MSGTRVEQMLTELLSSSADTVMDAELPALLVRDCAQSLSVTGAGIVSMVESRPIGTLAATDGPARVLEELQFTLGEGPCIDSAELGRPVLAPQLELTAPSRWPGFAAGALAARVKASALAARVKAVFAFPLQIGEIRLGVMDLYRDAEGDLDGGDLEAALTFGDAAVAVLLYLQAGAGPGAVHPAVAASVAERTEVHQATGMIAGQLRVSPAQALAVLRARSFASERPILAVSRDVLARILDLRD